MKARRDTGAAPAATLDTLDGQAVGRGLKLYGEAGEDTLYGGKYDDTLTGGDTVQASVTYALGAHVENLILTGTAAIDGTGNALNNTLMGNAAANRLDGGAQRYPVRWHGQ
ncbi:hypothetical protein [Desulfobulbus elongatus]|uniref:hypothetical protein n=1 Tax=Desulfobulbus elongatus TaxID=53332 RepID=UPI0004823BBB|nr:hypothetical protein [Desulfobulbus elongatus]